jgi:hypothetical protein
MRRRELIFLLGSRSCCRRRRRSGRREAIFAGYKKGASGPVGINRLDHAPRLAAKA